jgi:hypothetical protein
MVSRVLGWFPHDVHSVLESFHHVDVDRWCLHLQGRNGVSHCSSTYLIQQAHEEKVRGLYSMQVNRDSAYEYVINNSWDQQMPHRYQRIHENSAILLR